MRTHLRPLAAAALVALLAGCVHSGAPDLLDRAASTDASAKDARSVALAGFHRLLIAGKPDEARTLFDAALAKDAADPYALTGQMLLARRAGHPDRALDAGLLLLERAPAHPLASAAARFVLEISGNAVPLDDRILQRGNAALQRGLTGDAAHLVRSALANIHGQRGELALQSKVLADMGTPAAYTLVGPLSAFHLLEIDQKTPPEQSGSLEGQLRGPDGPLALRELVFLDGRMNLEGESAEGDVYLLAADVEVPAEGTFTLRTVSIAAHKVYVDGTVVIDRQDWRRPAPTVMAAGLRLGKGKHRLLVKLIRDDTQGSLTLSLMRADGRPAGLKFQAAHGPAPRWSGVPLTRASGAYAAAHDLYRALEPEVGRKLAQFLAVRDGMGRDREGAKALLAELEQSPGGIQVALLRAELALMDRSIPTKVARGRATRDLEAVLDADKGDVQALLTRASLSMEDERHLEAAEYARRARAAFTPVGPLVPLLEARIASALGVDAQAEQGAREAEAAQPGLCEALGLRYELARRKDAVQAADELVKALEPCPGSLSRSAAHARLRGDLEGTARLYGQLVERDPSQLAANLALTDALVALRRYDDAVALLERAFALWPRSTRLALKLAEVHELAGRPKQALAVRERALLIDGSQLSLRRTVERAKTGKELLADLAIDGREAIRAYEAQPGDERTPATTILDAAAVRVYPDGSMVNRIHMIQKALDQSGVQEIAEVNLPAGAQVLTLRTIKPDGTVLEPEDIEGKDTLSLPGVQVGDYVQQEYLLAQSRRGPAQPGFTAAAFYFQLARSPNHWSTYRVAAPQGMGMSIDAHNMTATAPKVVGDEELFDHEERRVPPYIPEPDSPPNANEYLPFVVPGAGTTGNEGVVAVYSDLNLDDAQQTFEVQAFAIRAAAGKKGLEAVKAIHAAVMQKLTGGDAGLAMTAASSVAQDRGSRLWLMKASLEAAGFATRLAGVNSFSADPSPYRFPNEAQLPYVCLRVEVPGAGEVWLDTTTRFGPFGVLPELARDRDAWLFPEPGRPLKKVRTPKGALDPSKVVTLDLTLDAEGVLVGSSRETYQGIEAAQIAEALESLPPDRRKQAVQGALSRYFGGAELSALELEIDRKVGAPMTIAYSFRAPNFARKEGGQLVLGALTFPAQLGRRFVQVGSRRTPLYIGETEQSDTSVKLRLPAGMKLLDPLGERPVKSDFGEYFRSEKQTGELLEVKERYVLRLARIPAERYEEFAGFAGDVDLVQSRDLIVGR